jgi:hypothetical protein
MFDHMQMWIGGLGGEAQDIIRSLTKVCELFPSFSPLPMRWRQESVRNHKNKRAGLDDNPEPGYGGCGHGGPKKSSQKIGGGIAGGYGMRYFRKKKEKKKHTNHYFAASKPPQSYGRNDNSDSNTGKLRLR